MTLFHKLANSKTCNYGDLCFLCYFGHFGIVNSKFGCSRKHPVGLNDMVLTKNWPVYCHCVGGKNQMTRATQQPTMAFNLYRSSLGMMMRMIMTFMLRSHQMVLFLFYLIILPHNLPVGWDTTFEVGQAFENMYCMRLPSFNKFCSWIDQYVWVNPVKLSNCYSKKEIRTEVLLHCLLCWPAWGVCICPVNQHKFCFDTACLWHNTWDTPIKTDLCQARISKIMTFLSPSC